MSARGAERGSTLVELLVATALGLLVVLACVQILRAHAALALRVQADLGAVEGARWALSALLRDVGRAGSDPRAAGITGLAEARADAITVVRDADGDGAVDLRSEESVAFTVGGAGGGSLIRRVGHQPMAIVSGLAPDGFRLRYYDRHGRELLAPLDGPARGLVRRVEAELSVRERFGTVTGRALARSGASLRLREGRP